jgi:hypothetical protein
MSLCIEEVIAAFLPLDSAKADKRHVWIIDTDGTVLFQSEHPEMVLKNIRRRDETCMQCHSSLDYVDKILVEKQRTIEYSLREQRIRKIHGYKLIAQYINQAQ